MVSIIMPSYNSEPYIAASITSVINQTYQDWELIIVDDASTDNSYNIISEFSKKDNRIKLIKQTQNLGAGAARNTAIKAAKGNYIAFLDSDDIWKPHKLEKQLEYMRSKAKAICFSSYELINEEGKPLNKIVEALPKLSYRKQLKCNYIGNLTGLYNAERLGKIYMPGIKKRQDWVMWLNAIKKGGKAIGIKESLAYYRVRKGSVSSNKFALVTHNFNMYNKELGFGFFKSVKYLVLFFYEYFFVKSKQTKRIKPT
ncbi:glycosyltransferase family 2 protein [Pontimicrobium aquaticum]|uniref:Glycosyltransferase family 2 protein n=1 Tax=Pontimicrobium aquaticum TaxID=2565367 RepID=A0A4U0ESJ7_9FLAO|nr:glycosyltransferase family 2 protein [Pontimicrobium aquaticum]TJY34755.1 glycosyltransferase family 2 protein [Pontimicrobium aquaticum]